MKAVTNLYYARTPYPLYGDSGRGILGKCPRISRYVTQRLDHAYSVVVHWRRNVFAVPSGKAGTGFVSELSRLFLAYAEGSALESIALKAAMTMCALL